MKTIELFAGGGGLALGLHNAGFSPVAMVERDADSCQTLRDNLQGSMNIDVRMFDKTSATWASAKGRTAWN